MLRIKKSIFFFALYTELFILNSFPKAFSQVDFWRQTNGPQQADVHALSVNRMGEIFAGTDGEGIFKSSNSGASWIKLNNGLSNLEIRAIATSPSDEIFIGTNGGGIFRSSDGGENWTQTNAGLLNLTVYSLAFNSAGVIFAGTGRPTGHGGLFRSTNKGNSWVQLEYGWDVPVKAVSVNRMDNIFIGTAGPGIYRSTDGGDTWTHLLTGHSISIATTSDTSIYVVNSFEIFRSTDNGNTWSQIFMGYPSFWVRTLTVNPSGYVFAGYSRSDFSYDGGGMLRSTDNGSTWIEVGNGLMNSAVRSLVCDENGMIFAGSYFKGIFRSTDIGDSWLSTNNGLTNSYVDEMIMGENGYMYAAVYGGVSKSTDNGESWYHFNFSDWFVTALARNASGKLFSGTVDVVHRSSDDGVTWTQFNTGLPLAFIKCLLIKSNGDVFAGTAAGLYRSHDDGVNWHQTSISQEVRSLLENTSGILYAGTDRGVYRSYDNGDNWILNISGLSNTLIQCLMMKPNGDLYAGTEKGIYNSTNNGIDWISKGLHGMAIQSLAANSAGHLFAGVRSDGVYRLTNDGLGWKQLNFGLLNMNVTSMFLDSVDYLYVGTQGGGIFRSVVSTLSAPQMPKQSWPSNGALDQPTTIGLAWSEAPLASAYHLQLATDSIFLGGIVVDDSAIVSTYHTVSGLMHTTTYYWHVRALNETGKSGWADTWHFTTAIAPPLSPILVFPSDGSTGLPKVFTLSWNPSLTSQFYQAQVSIDSTFKYIVFDKYMIMDTSIQVEPLEDSTIYYWRVRGFNVGGAGAWSSPIWQFTIGVTQTIAVDGGWNIVSLPLDVINRQTGFLFPTAITPAFTYRQTYTTTDSIQNGLGYWLKFSQTQDISMTGRQIYSDTLNLTRGWNIIGSISVPVPVSSIVQIPESILTSDFFEYTGNGYTIADTLKPGSGYWVKVSMDGILVLRSQTSLKTEKIWK